MNKKSLLGMFVTASVLFMTSCSNEDPFGVQSGGDANVSFSLGLEGGLASRAISDGLSAKKLVYALYDKDMNLIALPGADANSQVVKEDAFPEGLTDKVTLSLAKGQTYTIVFWAQNKDCTYYSTDDLKNVTVDYTGLNNDETRDAFFKAETFTVTGDDAIDVTLTRPFAQINVGVTADDWDAAVASNVNITTSKAYFKGVPNTINLLDGTVSGDVDVTYDFSTIPAKFDPAETLTVKISGEDDAEPANVDYKYLSMSYILADASASTVDAMKFTLHPEQGEDIVVNSGLNVVPVQRNWRTNIIGRLLSGVIDFNIKIDPIYEGDYNSLDFERVANGVSLDRSTNTYYIYSKYGLNWLNTQSNAATPNNFSGYTVKLAADIDMTKVLWKTGIGSKTAFLGTFDGDNHTISNLTVTVDDDNSSAGLFASARNVKNVRLVNVNISGHFKAGAISGDGLCSIIENCHVDGGKVISTPNSQKDNANNVGGIVGYLSAEPKASVTGCSVKNLDIVAYRDLGGVVGKTNGDSKGLAVKKNTVSNVIVTANQLVPYYETRDANAGEIVGRNMTNSALASNTATDVTVTVLGPVSDGGSIEVGNIPLEVIADLRGTNVGEVKLTTDIEGALTSYGNYKCGVIMENGMTLDGGGKTFTSTSIPELGTYLIQTSGGTIKNLTIKNAERGIVTNVATEDVIIENMTIDSPGYAINTAEHSTTPGLKLIVRNSTINGWTSFAGGFESAEFTNCKIGTNTTGFWQNYGYPQLYDGLFKPYINTVLDGCTFDQNHYIDLSALGAGCKVVFKQCNVNGTILTADNYASLIIIEVPGGKTLADLVDFN